MDQHDHRHYQQQRRQQQQEQQGRHYRYRQQQKQKFSQPMPSCPDDYCNQHPTHCRIQAAPQAKYEMRHGRTHHPSQSTKDFVAERSTLINMNPFSRSAKLVEMALANKNFTDKSISGDENVSDENNSNENECDEVRCGDNEGEENEIIKDNIETTDFNLDTSFSDYVPPKLPRKTNILQIGNSITNLHFNNFHLPLEGDYLDLSTGRINVVGRDNNEAESSVTTECCSDNERDPITKRIQE